LRRRVPSTFRIGWVSGLCLGLGAVACGDAPTPDGPTPVGARLARGRAWTTRWAGVANSDDALSEAEEIARLRRALAPRLERSFDGLAPIRTAAGSQRIDLDGRFSHVTVLTRSVDGSVKRTCITSTDQIDSLVRRARRGGVR
jgi:hypothetical protein